MLFVKAPSLAVLKKRLDARGSEERQDVALRMKTAKKELFAAKSYDYVFVNQDIETTFQKMAKTILAEIGLTSFN